MVFVRASVTALALRVRIPAGPWDHIQESHLGLTFRNHMNPTGVIERSQRNHIHEYIYIYIYI